jgi:SAM-dependent methyltransferase
VAAAGVPHHGTVLDLGAGTGQFLGPLAQWLHANVVAVEPSSAMRSEARAAGMAAPYVAANAEALPLVDGSIDVAWLSTVIHQFTDRATAVAELRRVVRPGGVVLVRGLFSDMEATGLLASFPGIERSVATFPRTADVVGLFRVHGFGDHTVIDVPERWEFEIDAWVARARSVRSTDSIFRPLTDDEFEAGLVGLLHRYRDHRGPIVSETALRLLVLRG